MASRKIRQNLSEPGIAMTSTPTAGIFAGCTARTASGTTIAAPARSASRSRRLIR
jgi:hypothetical protein